MARAAARNIYDTLELCDLASARLKEAGFVLAYSSDSSEACYYRWPDRPEVLRVAAHRFKKGKGYKRDDGAARVASVLTFNHHLSDAPGKMKIAEEKIESMIASAIGRYFLASTPAKCDGGGPQEQAVENDRDVGCRLHESR